MKKKKIKVIVAFIAGFSIFFIELPYWVWKNEGNSAVKEKELVEVSGHVNSLVTTTTTTSGRHPEAIIYLTLSEYESTFRIANNSYEAVNPSQVVNELPKGTKVELKVKDSELLRRASSAPPN